MVVLCMPSSMKACCRWQLQGTRLKTFLIHMTSIGSRLMECSCFVQVAVLVATAEGILLEYAIRNLRAPHGPSCALEQESFLLRADS